MTSVLEHVVPTHLFLKGDITASLHHDLSRASQISWDLETSGLDWKHDKIALCQLHADDLPVAIVRINGRAPERLRDLLENPAITKVFHHAMFDVRFMAHHWHALPQNLACTKIAAKLVLPGEAAEQKLQSLVSRFLGITLDKSEQRSNWSARSYSDAQLAYAAGDVMHLSRLLNRLLSELESRSMRTLAERCFEHIPTRVQLELGRFGDVYQY